MSAIATRPRSTARGRRLAPSGMLVNASIAVLALLTLFPLYFIAVNSLKDQTQFAQNQFALPAAPQWANYAQAFGRLVGPTLNTLFIVSVSVLGILVVASLAAYAFAVLRFPGKQALFFFVLALLLIPSFLTIIPLYLQIRRLGIANTPWALILPYIAGGQAFSIFVLKTFFEGISKELFEAARIDGAGEIRIYLGIVVPLSIPVLVSVGIVSFMGLWDDYLLPAAVLDSAHQTLAMALVEFQGAGNTGSLTDFGALMAAYAVSSVPLLLLFAVATRSFVEGLTSGSIKA